MEIGSLRDLTLNAAVLLAASILITFLYGFYPDKKGAAKVIIGLIAGVVGILVLTTTVAFGPGITFDTRSILVSILGMFFGWVPTLIASAIIVTVRIVMGGGGTFMGVLVTLVSAATGLLWRETRLNNGRLNNRFTGLEFYLVSLCTHALMLICTLTLPREFILPVLSAISLPVLLVYPLVSLLICMVIWSRLRQMQADAELVFSEARFRTLYEQTPIGVAFEDGLGDTHSNKVFDAILGTRLADMGLSQWPRALPGEDGVYEEERLLVREDGTEAWVHLTLAPLKMDGPALKSRMWLLQDITERKQKEEKIEYLTYHDPLTRMYNRTYHDRELRRLDRAEHLPLSVILGDVNGLKLVNDAFGHDEGDYLLTEIAKILQSVLREGDVAARIGGDEFLILLPNTDLAAAAAMYDSINAACMAHVPAPGRELVKISISLGYATKASLKEPLDAAIKTAERFMYRRKLIAHKNQYNNVLNAIRQMLYEKSDETLAHGEWMAGMAREMAGALALSKEDTAVLELASLLHDIGKVRVDLTIFKKPGSLTPEERAEIKKHAEAGYRIAQSVPHLNGISEIILYHHERWDGSGYPHGLAGESIPLLSRILSLIDAYAAMREDRAYRTARSEDAAAAEIMQAAGKQFDPELAQTFVEKVVRKESAGTKK